MGARKENQMDQTCGQEFNFTIYTMDERRKFRLSILCYTLDRSDKNKIVKS